MYAALSCTMWSLVVRECELAYTYDTSSDVTAHINQLVSDVTCGITCVMTRT